MKSGVYKSALLDPGSNKSFCSKALTNKLGLKGTVTHLALATLNDGKDHDAVEVSERRHEGRSFQLSIPFVKEPPEMPNNFMLAEQRLQSLRRRLLKDKALHSGYTAEMGKLLSSGYAEPVTEETTDRDGPTGMNWYLPHHPVLNANKPGKLRVMFDCAAEYGGVSPE